MTDSVTRPEVRVDGYWMSGIAPYWGGLRTSTRLNGDWAATWTVVLKPHQRPPALRYGAPVEVHLGPTVVFVGTLTEPDWDSGEMTAIGAMREAEPTPALTSSGMSTTKPNVAVDQAITRGALSWNRVDDFGSTAVGEADDQSGIYTVQSILDAWAQENASAWRIDRNRGLVQYAPTESDPKWCVVPGSGVLGSADDERVDRLFVRYQLNTNGALATASYPASSFPGCIERTMSIIDRGKKTAAQAADIAEAEWNKLQGRSGWTNGLTLTRGQVTTKGGVRADLALIRAGDAMRLLSVPDTRGLAANTDVVIGETEYDWDADTLQVAPVGLAARDDQSVLEQIGEIAANAYKAANSIPSLIAGLAGGKATVSISASSNGFVDVTWPTAYAAAPRSAGAVAENSNYNAAARLITATGCRIDARHINNTSDTISVDVRWWVIP